MLNQQINPLRWLWLTFIIVVFDQITKVWMSHTFILYESVVVLPFFNLTLVHNEGAAFSFLADAGGWQRWLLTGLALIVSLVIIIWLSRLKAGAYWLAIALALVLGGALGNLIDRVIYGYVVDFLDFYYNKWHWPAFNVADSAISLGAVMLLIDALRGESRMTDKEERLPTGQYLVDTLPVLDLGKQPKMNTDLWSLTLAGEIEAPQTLNWADLQTLPQREVIADIHCVTRWSCLDVAWIGVPASEIVRLARPKPTAQYVVLVAADEYTTNLPLTALLDDDVLFAHTLDGKPLPYKYGGPVRLVIPKRYFWKSAKWVTGIHFYETDQPGFWETRGYHNDADPFKEERFS